MSNADVPGWPSDLTGDRLVSARICVGFSRRELAELAGVTVDTIAVIENYGAGPARASRETKAGGAMNS